MSSRARGRTHYLYLAVIVAVVLGVVVGLAWPGVGKQLAPLGTGFVNLIKMMIAPVIFCTIVLGIGSVANAAKVGKVGVTALVYFLVMSTFSLALGLVVGNLLQPGSGLHLNPADVSVAHTQASRAEGGVAFLLGIIPTSFVSALTEGQVLQTLLVALLTGFALQKMGDRGLGIRRGIEHVQGLVFRILSMILWAAPVGAFGAIAAVVGATGWNAVRSLLMIMFGFYLTCLVFVFGVLGPVLRFAAGVSIFKLLKYFGREFLLILSTASSELVLPRLIAKMEHLGVSKPVVGIAVPTGYSFNLDGTAIYLTMATLFIATAQGAPLSLGSQISLLLFMIISSKGGRGRQRRGARHLGWQPAVASTGPRRRHRPHRRDRPVHVRGPRLDQLRGQRRRGRPHWIVDEGVRPRQGRGGVRGYGPVRRAVTGRRV